MKALVSLIAVLGSGAAVTAGPCAPKVYTLDADFDAGVMFNVNHNAPNGDQLQLNDSGGIQTLPVMYIANAGEDTVSKIDTNTNKEVARYRTWFGPSGQPGWAGDHDAWSGPAPSRSAVDDNGNAFVGNREFRSGKRATLVKILKTDYVDRNGNGVMDTSTDANNNGVIDASEIKAWGDSNGDNVIQDSEIGDERIAWIVEVGPVNGIARSVSIAPNGNIWVGYYNSQVYTEHSPATGAQVSGPWSTSGHRPYGSLVDANGILWGAGWDSQRILRFNTITKTYTIPNPTTNYQVYGIAIGTDPASPTTTRVYMAHAADPYLQYTDGGAFVDPSGTNFRCYGISVDAGGNILASGSTSGSYYGCSKFSPAGGAALWSKPAQSGATGADQRGAIVDSNGDVWTVNRPDSKVSKFRGTDGAHLGVFPVGLYPYTYSDASGSSFIQTNPTGTWEVVYDAGELGAKNCVFSWTSQESNGSSLEVRVDASDTKTTVGEFNPNTAVVAGNGVPVPVIAGRYVYVRVKFTAANQTSPVLKDLTIKTCPQRGDLNNDCCIDRADLNLVMAHIRARLPYNAALDVNLDGVVDLSDARQIVLWFCFPLGAPCPSA